MSDLRMNAYFYSFAPTGDRAIDEILSAVASAGKARHCTEDWGDDCSRPGEDHLEGQCPIDWIQNAAQRAANTRTDLVPGWVSVSEQGAPPIGKIVVVETEEGCIGTDEWLGRSEGGWENNGFGVSRWSDCIPPLPNREGE